MQAHSLHEKSLEYWAALRSEASLVPANHYFHSWLALAAFELERAELGEALLGEYFTLERRGHIEFNKLALLHIVERHGAALSETLATQVEACLVDGNFSVDFTTSTGNNWLVLRTLIHLKLALRFNRPQDLEAFRAYFDHVMGLADGGLFFDYPPLRDPQHIRAFPLTYSFKMLALFLECLGLLEGHGVDDQRQAQLRELVQQALPVHLAFIAPDGEALYYGRSDNTLFGYANLLAVLARLRPDPQVEQWRVVVRDYIRRHFVKDGILTTAVAAPGFRDAYVHDSVYCAYFIAMTLMSDKGPPPLCEVPQPLAGAMLTTPIGFLVRSSSAFAFISGRGCSLPQKGSDFSGYRYTGLTPFKFWCNNRGDAGLLAVNRGGLGALKSEIPLLPLGRGFGVKLQALMFEEVHISDNGTECKLRGHAAPLTLVAHPTGRRILRHLGRRRPGLRRWLTGVSQGEAEIVRDVYINYATCTLRITDHLPPGSWHYLIPAKATASGDKVRCKTQSPGVNRLTTTGGRVIITLGAT